MVSGQWSVVTHTVVLVFAVAVVLAFLVVIPEGNLLLQSSVVSSQSSATQLPLFFVIPAGNLLLFFCSLAATPGMEDVGAARFPPAYRPSTTHVERSEAADRIALLQTSSMGAKRTRQAQPTGTLSLSRPRREPFFRRRYSLHRSCFALQVNPWPLRRFLIAAFSVFAVFLSASGGRAFAQHPEAAVTTTGNWQYGFFAAGGFPPDYQISEGSVISSSGQTDNLTASEKLYFWNAGFLGGHMLSGYHGHGLLRRRGELMLEVMPFWLAHYPRQDLEPIRK